MAAGAALIAVGHVLRRQRLAVPTLSALSGLLVAATGLLLLIGGKQVALALRVERSRHRELPGAIRTARQARRRGR